MTEKTKNEHIQVWVDSTSQYRNDTEIESDLSEVENDGSTVYISSSDYEDETVETKALGTQIPPSELSLLSEKLDEINSIQTVGNVNITNSSNVHIGNITKIYGDIHIHDGRDRDRSRQKDKSKTYKDSKKTNVTRDNHVECIDEKVFLKPSKFKLAKEVCSIIPRCNWLAQSPMEDYDYIEEPVQYVIISHTATESSLKQAINIKIIRHIQVFHIESHGWNDIAYNFLIGCDGNIYEGRGWGVVGAHTLGYNTISMGISFVGCFMKELPTVDAINAINNLLKKGVRDGHLTPDYKIICHCQCRSTESPGRRLYEEIKTWEHFYNIEDEEEETSPEEIIPNNAEKAE